MSKQTLVFNDIEVNKKDFHTSKKAIPLNSVNTNNMVISYRVKHNDKMVEKTCHLKLKKRVFI